MKSIIDSLAYMLNVRYRVKSGKFGRSARFGQRPCLFHILTIGIKKNYFSKQ